VEVQPSLIASIDEPNLVICDGPFPPTAKLLKIFCNNVTVYSADNKGDLFSPLANKFTIFLGNPDPCPPRPIFDPRFDGMTIGEVLRDLGVPLDED
jgi:hypothetical protein